MDFDIKTGRALSTICRDTDPIKDYVGERYFNIWDFMIFDFKLEKVELLVYAIIFTMYKNTRKCFRGSRAYLAKWTGASIRTVATALKSLEQKEYIDKVSKCVNGRKRVVYYINFEKLPTCKTFSSANYARDVWQRNTKEQAALGIKVKREELYLELEKLEEDTESSALRYVQMRDSAKQMKK